MSAGLLIMLVTVAILWGWRSETVLRIGLWMNNVTGSYADDVVKTARKQGKIR